MNGPQQGGSRLDPSAVASVAAYSTAVSQERLADEVSMRTLKKAMDQQGVVLDLLLRTFQAAATGLGRQLDVYA